MQCKGKTDIGLLRKENQDTFLIKEIHGHTLGIVCDGMGGMQQGGLAAELASEAYAKHIENAFDTGTGTDDIPSLLKNAAQTANRAVYDYALANGYFYGMGTTLVSFLKTDDRIYVLNIGDSRCYKLKDGRLTKITKDHSYVQQLVDIGILTEEKARTHPDGNIITRSVGIESRADPDVFEDDGYDAVLLCSDGLSKCAEDETIEKIMCSGKDPAEICDELVKAALDAGGPDNVTVVVLI